MRRGEAVSAAELGNPVPPGGTRYAVCLYDGADALVASLEVDRAGASCRANTPCWRPNGEAFLYRDPHAAADGIKQLLLRGGPPGSPTVLLAAGNDASRGQTALTAGLIELLAGSPRITVQVRGSDAPRCLSVRLEELAQPRAGLVRARKR